MLVKVKGTPLADNDDVDAFDFIPHHCSCADHDADLLRTPFCRTRADERTDSGDVFYGWRKLDFYGCKLLTTPNPEEDKDPQLFRKLAKSAANCRAGGR